MPEPALKPIPEPKPAEAPRPRPVETAASEPVEEPVGAVVASSAPETREPAQPPRDAVAKLPEAAPRPKINFEEFLGKKVLPWVGVLLVFICTAFFVKLAVDYGWIRLNEKMRVLAGVVAGGVVVALGVRFCLRHMRPLGQGLIGGGMAMAYVSVYAGFGYYKFVPQPVAFGGLAVIAALGIVLAVAFDALPVSFISVLGGFLTPVLVSTGQDMRDALFAYVLVLDLGVLGVAWFRRWRALDVLAFLGTAALFTLWFSKFYTASGVIPALAWLGGFFLVFLALPFR